MLLKIYVTYSSHRIYIKRGLFMTQQVTVPEAFKKGGMDIKLSALIMGFANFANKQFTKGFLF